MQFKLTTIISSFNYGANLQALATIKFLENFGRVHLDSRQPKKITDNFSVLRFTNLKYFMVDLLFLYKRYKKKLYLRKLFGAYRYDIRDNNHCIQVLGSDQIWNPNVTTYEQTFFDPFLPESTGNQSVITLASSMGNVRNTLSEDQKFIDRLKKYDYVSVRENVLAIKLQAQGVNADVIADPTHLLTLDEWKKLLPKRNRDRDRPYILVYSVPKLKTLKKSVEAFIRLQNDYDIIEITNSPRTFIRGAKRKSHIELAEFFNLFLNASFVVTDSFHGTAFSCYCKKNFVTFTNVSLDARIISFLEPLGLIDRVAYDVVDIHKAQNELNFPKQASEELEKIRLANVDKLTHAIERLKY